MTDPTSDPADPFATDPFATDPFTTEAGAYVLGALSQQERAAFEVHLAGCSSCRADVAGVAGLPSLLDRVPRDLVDGLGSVADQQSPGALGAAAQSPRAPAPGAQPVSSAGWWGTGRVDAPPGMLMELLRLVRQEERSARRRRTLVGALAAAAVVVLTLAVSGTPLMPWSDGPGAPTVTASVTAEAFELMPVVDVPVSATAVLDAVAWGTLIDLSCRYDTPAAGQGGGRYDDGPDGQDPPTYSLVVQDAAGTTEEVATWSAVPGKDLTIPASTVMPRAEIVLVELRNEDGTALLRART